MELRAPSLRFLPLALLCGSLATAESSAASPVCLAHLGHQERSQIRAKHLMGVETVLDHHALVSSHDNLCLIDLEPLAAGNPQDCLDTIQFLDSTTTVTRADGWVYVNLLRAGLAVVRLDEASHTLTLIGEIHEPGVFYEHMTVVGDRLYVAAHAHGMRIYDLTDPSSPVLIGSLQEGLTDVFAIAVDGDTAYLADGGGGLKIVDLSDETSPRVVAGETTDTAAGTAEHVMVVGQRVYVASGGAGVAVYELGNVYSRVLHDTPICAKYLAVAGNHLAVADIGGLEVFSIESDGSLTPAARESAKFRWVSEARSLRIWSGVAGWGDRILTATWDTADLYELVDAAVGSQPDITASLQRIRFSPEGGETTVRITNDGAGPLVLEGVSVTETSFTVQPTQALLQPGESLDLTVTHSGRLPGEAMALLDSNDPDEDPLPIQLFGRTDFLDPGEPAIPFQLEAWRREDTQWLYETYDLGSMVGRVVHFHVFSST